MKKWLLSILVAFIAIQINTSCSTAYKQKVYMSRTYKKIKHTVKDAQVSHLQDTVKILFPNNLLFGFNSATLNRNVLPSMGRLASALNKFDHTAIMISGYTDNLGEESYNNVLSAQRADTTKHALLQFDVAPQRVNTWGMGARHPVATNETEEGRAKNRRVEFIILYQPVK